MRLIFNEKVTEKCNLWVCEQCIKILFTEDLINNCDMKERKKKRRRAYAQSKHSHVVDLDDTLSTK